MSEQSAPIYAAIDVGSNTIHIVVAHCTADDLTILADEVEMVRIGESVTATGAISEQKRDAAIATIRQYQTLAEQHGAEKILVVATEAIRKASNNAEFIKVVKEATGLEMVLVDGMVEATLTFMGATYPLRHEFHAPDLIGVMDIGGGSTELVTAEDERILWRTSFPLGSGWLHDRYLPSDPPTHDELEVAQTFLHTFIEGIRLQQVPSVLIVTGGSANSLLYLVHGAFGVELTQERMSYDDLLRCQGLLYALPAEEIARRFQQPLGRALILPAGASIIQAFMQHFQLDEIRVSPHGIREGTLLAYARYGEQWQAKIAAQVEQQEQRSEAITYADDSTLDELVASDASFTQIGRRLIIERAQKMLEWRDEVLRNEDPEAVHKMRVATRRLRAALDAYASLCDPKALRKGYRSVKKLANALGNARDVDVLIQHLQEQLAQIGDERGEGIRWFIARLKEYRQQQQEVLESLLLRLDGDALLAQLASCLPEGEE